MQPTQKTTSLAALLCLLVVGGVLAQSFEINWYTIDGGAGIVTGGADIELAGTIGQPDASVTVMTGGSFELTGGLWSGVGPDILSVCSVLTHGAAGDFCLELGVGGDNIEPRASGVLELDFEVSSAVSSVFAEVECDLQAYTGTVTATPAGTTVIVEFSPALFDEDCCEVTLAGDVVGSAHVRTLKGDVNRDGQVTTGDASAIKPHFQETLGPGNFLFDYNVDGLITTGDFSGIKPLFQHTAPACP